MREAGTLLAPELELWPMGSSMGAQRSENFMPLSSFFRKGPLCEVPRPTCIRMPDISKIMGMVFCCYAQRIVKMCNKDLIL